LQEPLHDAERKRSNIEPDGEQTVLHDAVIDKLREEIKAIEGKAR
jgi:hypothetical protein